MQSKDITAVFDRELNYLLINEAGCRQLQQPPEKLVGNCILDLYPQIIASENHRNLLRAVAGESVKNILIQDGRGGYFKTWYRPILRDKQVVAVIATARQVRTKTSRSVKAALAVPAGE